jgi:hypothetical protein
VETLTKDEGHDEPLMEKEMLNFNTRKFGALASPYVSPYVYKKQPWYLDTQYGIRKVGDQFMLGNPIVVVDTEANVQIGEPDTAIKFNAAPRIVGVTDAHKVDKQLVTQSDLQTYKNILEMTNAHLERYEPGANIQISKEVKFRDVITILFPDTSARRDVKRQQWVTY